MKQNALPQDPERFCIHSVAATQTRTVARFTSLDLPGSNNVTIIVGRPQSVVAQRTAT